MLWRCNAQQLHRGRPFLSLSLSVILVSAWPGRSCHGSHTGCFISDFSADAQKLTLLRDAKVLGSALQIAGSQASTVGGVFYSQPVRLTSRFREGLQRQEWCMAWFV
ncbi:hypothetical protein KP509_31G001600 [Ceratopteris richardii]|uniref:Secreted protein n=1 Tax=Ceratopteris richardii TaxID=49495 RepID=A0A8T2QW93_CERRI|nr:hypothetical protein KP509_31G001600 [Ceratopteris richardii]